MTRVLTRLRAAIDSLFDIDNPAYVGRSYDALDARLWSKRYWRSPISRVNNIMTAYAMAAIGILWFGISGEYVAIMALYDRSSGSGRDQYVLICLIVLVAAVGLGPAIGFLLTEREMNIRNPKVRMRLENLLRQEMESKSKDAGERSDESS